MSKSYNNCIYLDDSPETVEKKVKTMVTDPGRKRREDKGNPEVCPVFFHHKLYNEEAVTVIDKECREATRGCVDCKKEMAAKLNEFLAPVQKRRKEWESRKDEVVELIHKGNERAREVAGRTLKEAMQAIGLRKK